MANKEDYEHLKAGSQEWNSWRKNSSLLVGRDFIDRSMVGAFSTRGGMPDLSRINLSNSILNDGNFCYVNFRQSNLSNVSFRSSDLRVADFRQANLKKADLSYAYIDDANFGGARGSRTNFDSSYMSGTIFNDADFPQSNFRLANLTRSKFVGANLRNSDLYSARLLYSDFRGAILAGANLVNTSLVSCDFRGTDLSGCNVYGASVWDTDLTGAKQKDLVITPPHETHSITVDNLQVAQFVYLILKNPEIRNVVDTITSKAVLILGNFSKDRKKILDDLKNELRNANYLPILFDFDKPDNRDLTETIATLAHLSRFVIVDITDAKSVPQELQAIIPNLPSVPIQPIIEKSSYEYGMFEHFKNFPWVLDVFRYQNSKHLLTNLLSDVIDPAEKKVNEIRSKSL